MHIGIPEILFLQDSVLWLCFWFLHESAEGGELSSKILQNGQKRKEATLWVILTAQAPG